MLNVKNFIDSEILSNQTLLVNDAFKSCFFDYGDVINMPVDNEIYEWWLVTEYAQRRLLEYSECILDNRYGVWWGRTCTGQAIEIDDVIINICNR